MRLAKLILFSSMLAACASHPTGPGSASIPREASTPLNYQKEKSHFMNINPSIVVGHFKLVDRFCTESTFWYSNLLDYMKPSKTEPTEGPALESEELTLTADGTFKRIVTQAKKSVETAGTFTIIEQGPTKVIATTRAPKAKATTDQQLGHKIDLVFQADGAKDTELVSINLVATTYDKLALVQEVERDGVCVSPTGRFDHGNSLNKIYERIKP